MRKRPETSTESSDKSCKCIVKIVVIISLLMNYVLFADLFLCLRNLRKKYRTNLLFSANYRHLFPKSH